MRNWSSGILWLIWFVFASLLAVAQSAAIDGVEAVGLTVSNMEQSVDYYCRVLNFEKVSDVTIRDAELRTNVRVVRIRLGEEQLVLSEFAHTKSHAQAKELHSNDLSFQHVAIVVSDMDQAYAWLRRNNVHHVSSGPQTLPAWNKEAAGIQAFYFEDPDKHVLEIIHFPQGKGDPRWGRNNGGLFLGIDHTAIVVSDTMQSQAFYTGKLAMHVTGESENYGYEQEHLNNVFGAHLKITSLHAASGPGIEFLEYLSPRTGRAIPSGNRRGDSNYWETILKQADVVEGGRSNKTLRLRDPDGHIIAIDEGAPPNNSQKETER